MFSNLVNFLPSTILSFLRFLSFIIYFAEHASQWKEKVGKQKKRKSQNTSNESQRKIDPHSHIANHFFFRFQVKYAISIFNNICLHVQFHINDKANSLLGRVHR